MSQKIPTSTEQRAFTKQFWKFTAEAEKLEREARQLLEKSAEVKVNRLTLMREYIQIGGKVSPVQKKRLGIKEEIHVSLMETRQDPGVKDVIEDIRAGILIGLHGLEKGTQAIIKKVKK
jgi:hypothetical protein